MSSGRPPFRRGRPPKGKPPRGPGQEEEERGRPPRGPGQEEEERGKPPQLPGEGDPVVLLDTELVEGKLWLVLANPGDRAAFDVVVELEGSLLGVGGERDLAGARLFQGLPLLRPGREIRVFIDVARLFFAREEATEIEARVTWESRHGDRFAQTFRHDLAIWEDFGEVL